MVPLCLQPSLSKRGEKRKEEGSTELGFKYSTSYKIEDKSRTLWGREGAGRNRGQIPPPPGGDGNPRAQRGKGQDWGKNKDQG